MDAGFAIAESNEDIPVLRFTGLLDNDMIAVDELFDNCMARIDNCRDVRSGCITPPAICLLPGPL